MQSNQLIESESVKSTFLKCGIVLQQLDCPKGKNTEGGINQPRQISTRFRTIFDEKTAKIGNNTER